MGFRRAFLLLAWVFPCSPASAAQVADVVRSGYADVHGGKIYYEASGRGPHVVFLSGGNWMDLREWDGQFIAFSRTFQAIRFDARGSGKSDAPVAQGSRAADLGAFLDRLRLRQVHLVGLSRSAGVALDFALAWPDRVLSLVLVSPIVSGWEPSEKYREREAALLGVLKKSGARAFADAVLDDPYLVPSGGRRKAAKLLKANARRVLSLDASAGLTSDPPAIARLGEIRAPALLILGDEDDPEILELGEVLASRIPGARKEVLFGAGHSVNLERSRKLNRVVIDFLRSVPPVQEGNPR